MGQTERHDERECVCVLYTPKLEMWEIRSNGVNFLCRNCNRYVDPAKWHGGVVKFQKRFRVITAIECPCCGQRMSKRRRAKKKLEDSVKHQFEHPELHNPRALRILMKKMYLIDNDILIPRVK